MRQDSAVVATPTTPTIPTTPSTPTTSTIPQVTFFDLPPELRNLIYASLIHDATLSLGTNSTSLHPKQKPKFQFRRRKSAPTPINGLLLASRQCRHEYLSLLLSTVRIVIEVHDFSFEHLTKVSSALAPSDLEALRLNPRLTIHLHTHNCTEKNLRLLRRWLVYRTESQKKRDAGLPWIYEFPLESLLPSTRMGRLRLLRELEYYVDTLSRLAIELQGAQLVELQAIIVAFETKATWLEEHLGAVGQSQKLMLRDVRGLMGGGVR